MDGVNGEMVKSGAVSQWPVAGNGSSCPAGKGRRTKVNVIQYAAPC